MPLQSCHLNARHAGRRGCLQALLPQAHWCMAATLCGRCWGAAPTLSLTRPQTAPTASRCAVYCCAAAPCRAAAPLVSPDSRARCTRLSPTLAQHAMSGTTCSALPTHCFARPAVRACTQVALKALSLRGLRDWKQLELFQREAVVLQGLSHPNIPVRACGRGSDSNRSGSSSAAAAARAATSAAAAAGG